MVARGEMLGDHHLWRKGYPYEGSSRIPFLLHGPQIPAGAVRDEIVELRDVMPTLLACAGVTPPEDIDGGSVLPLLRNDNAPWRRHLHGEHTLLEQSLQWILRGRHKYVWLSATGEEQLFDLATDPQELHDLSADSRYPQILSECRNLLIDALKDRGEGPASMP
ncbi:MAG TPA: sulfatase/phosphatase domain-containing protein [Candidatus Limnocylindrales bacterium]